ncbi:MAG: TonB-dependent receptor [Bacteroidetes bacterium]|nr:MAG: TonB-dependent receptor [Bacteroidota bacterium]
MKFYLSVLIAFVFNVQGIYAQSGVLKGRVYNSINNEGIAFASVYIESEKTGAVSDIAGNYQIENIKPGTIDLKCSSVGYKELQIKDVIISNIRTTVLDIALEQNVAILDEVNIKPTEFTKPIESPLSLRTINAAEIYRNPGGNRDISKVIQILPGVASTVSFRNDIIVRGGAPNENRFYLDGIEVPNINHFATQGSSGGPVGLINVNFIREVDFYAGAFPSNRGNALSSVMEFKQMDGNEEKLSGTFMLGSSDVGLTLNGPIGKKSTFLLSARRSYLQLLFKALSLPFLPTYNDFQYKQKIKFNLKNELTIIGLGAIDDFELNKKVNDNISDPEIIQRNNYILGNLPVNTQWNYTGGLNWKHFSQNSYQNIVLSRNQLNNKSRKYINNIKDPALLIFDYESRETENKLRFENTWRKNGWKLNSGLGAEHVQYSNSTFNKREINNAVAVINYNSKLSFNKYALFMQVSKSFFNERLSSSLGLRTDFNDYSSEMANPAEQISPVLSLSYSLSNKVNLNFNAGRYYQLPVYTLLGYRDSSNNLVNKSNNIKYIHANHLVAGIDFIPKPSFKISLEGFYKTYRNYPFLLSDSITLANLGGDFGVIGNEAATSSSDGRSYGLELFMQQKLSSSIYGILSYTFVRSEFKDKSDKYVPSSWDNRHILNITAGKKFKRNWEMGMKFRLLGGAPYTPYDVNLSSTKTIWDVTRQGIPDWNRLNTERNSVSHGMDIRIDKKWFFKKWALNLYLDIQNIYNSQTSTQDYIDVVRDNAGNPVESTDNPLQYKTYKIKNTSGNILPSVGVMVEF